MAKQILVVDDSQFILKVMVDMLVEFNYAVTTADNGLEAYKLVESIKFDMIITDLNMPVMDGLEFTSRVRLMPNCKFVPIVMISDEANDAKVAKAKQMGVATFLSKPVKKNQLKSILQVALGV